MTQTMQFVCISCGNESNKLYHEYKGGIIKITICVRAWLHCFHVYHTPDTLKFGHYTELAFYKLCFPILVNLRIFISIFLYFTMLNCIFYDRKMGRTLVIESCGCVVDKYIEYDLVIVSLDALLLKRQAFRHILINSGIKSHWKFLLVLLICEALTKLLGDSGSSDDKPWRSDNVIYTALEIDLYWNFVSAAIEMLCFILGVLMCISVVRLFSSSTEFPSYHKITNGLILSCLGKILILPAMLWGLNYSVIYTQLCTLFTVASNVQSLRVLLPHWNTACIIVCIVCGHFLSYWTNIGLQIIKTGLK